MQRFINNPDLVVDDTVRGFVKAHSDLVKLGDNPRVVAYAQAPIQGKVGVVTGGGSGHEPAFIGYVGRNMLDAVAVGEIFSSPTAKSFHDAMTGRRRRLRRGLPVRQLRRRQHERQNGGQARGQGRHRGADRRRQRRRLFGAARRARKAPRGGGRGPDVEGRRRQGGAGRELWRRCAPRRRRRSTIAARSASASGLARCRRSATPISRSSRERWRSASAITASRARASSL